MPRFKYVVRATRRVRYPKAGPEAYFLSSIEREFPFGAHVGIKGPAALKAANDEGEKLAKDPEACEVTLWRLTVGGGGYRIGVFLDSPDRYADMEWPEKTKQRNRV